MLDLLFKIAHLLEALVWIGGSLKRAFYRVLLPRSPHSKPLEWGDWLMLSCLAFITVLVIALSLSEA